MSVWVTGGIAAGGLVMNAIGANKQSQDNAAAQRQNKEQFEAQQLQNWNQYLMQRGIDPTGNTKVGGYGSGQAINSRLPLWASVQRQEENPGEFRVVRRSAMPAAPRTLAPGRLVAASPNGMPSAAAAPQLVAADLAQ